MTVPGESTFLFAEEGALRDWLKGCIVSDGSSGNRPVGVWFGQPDPEIRKQGYPYITIDLVGITEANERLMTRYGDLDLPGEVGTSQTEGKGDYPTPIDLTYQISTWTRQPRHDRQVISQLMHRQLQFRFSQLSIVVDGTVRRLVVVGFAKRDTVEGDKRLFRNIWTITLSSEIFRAALDEIYRVQSVNINSSAVPLPEESLSFVFPT